MGSAWTPLLWEVSGVGGKVGADRFSFTRCVFPGDVPYPDRWYAVQVKVVVSSHCVSSVAACDNDDD